MENKAKLNTIISDALQVIKNPVAFYKEMPKTGGFTDPLIFLVVMSVIAGMLLAVLSLLDLGMGQGMAAAGIAAIFIMPLFAILASFISAAIIFVIWKLMGSEAPYETAYRCIAYASALYPIAVIAGVIPYLGTVIGVIWGMYLMIVASTEVHALEKRTVLIVFGILGFLLLFLNISGEMASRQMNSQLQDMSSEFKGFGKQLEQLANDEDMTPEEAGKALGEFLKGLEQATKDSR